MNPTSPESLWEADRKGGDIELENSGTKLRELRIQVPEGGATGGGSRSQRDPLPRLPRPEDGEGKGFVSQDRADRSHQAGRALRCPSWGRPCLSRHGHLLLSSHPLQPLVQLSRLPLTLQQPGIASASYLPLASHSAHEVPEH